VSRNAASAHIARVDPAFGPVIEAAGPFDPRAPEGDAFNALARAIVFQQLAGNAARAIHGRFAALYDGTPTAAAVLATSIDDLGVRKGFARVHGLPEPLTPKQLASLGEIYRPYRSVAAWYCWRAVETVLPSA
jgi:3-methyladenine DNA glycosylase/8-oxoguanine DNA glycosylase